MIKLKPIAAAALTTLCLTMTGCSEPSPSPETTDSDAIVIDGMPPSIDHDEHPEQHPERGPHGGELVELGKEDYHIEIVHQMNSVVLHILDGSANAPVAIDAPTITVSLKHQGNVQAFDLAAQPETQDVANTASRFQSGDRKLIEWMQVGAEGAVVVNIDGRSYTGLITHQHDHEH